MIKDAQKSATLRKRDFSPALFVGVLTIITAFSGLLLSSPRASAGSTGGLDTSVSITAACSLSVDDTSHFASAIPGSNVAIGTSTITAICNDPAGVYWSSNRYSSISAYSEDFNSDGLRSGSNDDIVYLGLTMRCVADWSERAELCNYRREEWN